MLPALKTIAEVENEAKKIVEAANIRAEEIKRKAREESEKVYEKTCRQTVAQAKRRAAELEKKTREDAELEAKKILTQAEEQTQKIRAKAKANFDAAVETALHEVLS